MLFIHSFIISWLLYIDVYKVPVEMNHPPPIHVDVLCAAWAVCISNTAKTTNYDETHDSAWCVFIVWLRTPRKGTAKKAANSQGALEIVYSVCVCVWPMEVWHVVRICLDNYDLIQWGYPPHATRTISSATFHARTIYMQLLWMYDDFVSQYGIW